MLGTLGMLTRVEFRFLISKQAWLVASLLVILAVVTAIRIRLLDLPLERDEGEYAYAVSSSCKAYPRISMLTR